MKLVLASTSSIRKTLLDQAGIEFEAVAPKVDEETIKQGFLGPDHELALRLAEAKALGVDGRADALVIGSDSLVSVSGRRFSKPRDRKEAADHLRAFSGQVIELTSGVAVARNGELLWSGHESARLTVRPLSEEFIHAYLDREWPEVRYCVGVFRLEGPGVQLFDSIKGDHFTILGLPLLPLLRQLRQLGALPS